MARPPQVGSIGLDNPTFFHRQHLDMPQAAQGSLAEVGLPVKSIGAVFSQTTLSSNAPKTFADGPRVRVIPMGGLNEVGLNMTAIECGDDIIVIDTGFGFGGGEKYPGIDYVLPDTTWLEQNRHKIRGVVYTHGHLDHIGGAPYILPRLGDVPLFGTPFGLELLKNRLQEFHLDTKYKANVIDIAKPLKLGVFTLQFFRLNHSIPDVVGICIDTPMGRILYCTDWKFDHTPFDNEPSDYAKLSQFGQEGVRLLMTDALGVLKPGYSPSEKEVEKNVLEVFKQCAGRIVFTSFSSNIARMQHVVNAAYNTGRKLAIVGRSMDTNFNAAFRLGKVKVPQGLMVDIQKTRSLAPEKVVILSTGSQGEDAAALSRMAKNEHPHVKLQGGDSVIFSSSPIPGNEASVQDLMSSLTKIGVEVFSKPEFNIYVTGHACIEDLKLMFSLTKPDYLQPIHGEHFMLVKAARLGAQMGIPAEHCLVGMNGRITEMGPLDVHVTDDIITDKYLLVDGSGMGTVPDVVLDERRQMNKEGSIIIVLLVNRKKELVTGPEIISRGFVYMKNSQTLFDEIKTEMKKKYDQLGLDPNSETFFSDLRRDIKKEMSEFVYRKTEKMPMIIPVVVQV
jgi:ribonuclease J